MSTELTQPVISLLQQLQLLLDGLTDEQYCARIKVLSNASIGQHMRHIIEFFLELENGYETGIINYDQRKRDHEIETGRACAHRHLQFIMQQVSRPNKPLTLVASFDAGGQEQCSVATNYLRELVYNLEHTVHHMALLRIGANAVSDIALQDDFGVAASTIKHRTVCAQ